MIKKRVIVEYEEVIENVGDETYSLMVYMCAADLESELGMASSDLTEMLNGYIDEKLNVIIQTGGTEYWQDYEISADANQ